MPDTTTATARPALSDALLDHLLARHRRLAVPRYARFWRYYRNPLTPTADGTPGRPAQLDGMPARFRSPTPGAVREVVIENDIAWRIHTLVDFMFGRPLALQSTAADPSRAATLETFLRAVFDAAGGSAFFHDLGLLGAIYGHADILLRIPTLRFPTPRSPRPEGVGSGQGVGSDPLPLAAQFRLELIEAPRAVPLLNPGDYRRLDAFVLHYRRPEHRVAAPSFLSRLRGSDAEAETALAATDRTEVFTADTHAIYAAHTSGLARRLVGRRLVERSLNPLGRIPVVHIQNLPQPFAYEGLGEVEPLIPLQDELNTRLSDRANRITFQCFKMYLGKGIDGFTDRLVGPGQMWSTDNLQASIEEFGGDAECPSELAHIAEIREAMDKASGVSPLAAGVIRDRIGNLTSENALRVTMMGLLAKTAKKRVAYAAGIARLCELILHAADVTGVLPNTPDERTVRLDWPEPLPAGERERLEIARLKLDLGVPRSQVLAELGYTDCVH